MYDEIKKVVVDSGLWDGPQRTTHDFLLSPAVYDISETQKNELEKLGKSLRDCLAGIGQITTITATPALYHSRTWKALGSILCASIPAWYREIQVQKPGAVPTICKVDLMQTSEGYRIAEIDGHNKHGLGYSILCARMRDAGPLLPGARTFDGVACAIAREMETRRENTLMLLYAEQERFYLPEFRILANELARLGVCVTIYSETEISAEGFEHMIEYELMQPMLLVDFPFLYRNAGLRDLLSRLYREGKIDFLYPPKPFLSSKALLAILRNDECNSELEAILHAFIPEKSLACVRGYIPETHLVQKMERGDGLAHYRKLCERKPFLLKEVISSGMHGTVFMDDRRFEETLRFACASRNKFILQDEVQNKPQQLVFYTDGGKVAEAMWFLRVTVLYALHSLYAPHSIADIDVTARQDKRVHGAKDCLQLGTIIV